MENSPEGKRRSPESDPALSIVALLLSGIVVWGGIGWFIDRWMGTVAFLPIGMLVGLAGALYLVIKRYGQE